jgi:predicted GTPase
MHKASLAMAHGADFILIGATYTMLKSQKPVIAVCAVRTGCGKSQTTRKVCEILKKQGKKVVAVRHPMPYGDLLKQVVQRFSCLEDLKTHNCTIEEQEEYEPLIEAGITVFAGVDYKEILLAAEKEADVIVWDGGNNDTPFYRPDMHIVLLDPHRPGHELSYYPGETNLIMAQAAIINKIDTAKLENIEQVRQNIAQYAPQAHIILASSPFVLRDPGLIKGKRVLVVEDGPTLTHGGMSHGAGLAAARAHGAAEIVDPRPFAQGSIKQAFSDYPHMGPVTPALGYSADQIKDLEKTIALAECDLVLFATPIQLTRILSLNKPAMRVRYEYQDAGQPTLEKVMRETLPNLFQQQG